jgi:excisionase family DNA binding protein
MNERHYTPKELSSLLGVTTQTLKEWENKGKIEATKTPGGHRRYLHTIINPQTIEDGEGTNKTNRRFIYARVSSYKQKEDLQRQVAMLQTKYPEFEVVQDIASGINFKRRGLVTILDQVFAGNVSTIVVAHKDRLTRFGFELFQYVFKKFKVSLEVVSDDDVKEPITELAKDLLSIVTVFTARYHGSRKYKVLQENKVLPKQTTSGTTKQVRRNFKILLQQKRSVPK